MPRSRLAHLSSGIFWVVFAGMLIDFFYSMSIGWHQIIGTGAHGFRQTQTLLSALFMTKGSPWLIYETPVLGPPWAIPFEFPIYQWCVAGFAQLTGYPLDESARLISVGFFLGCLIFVWKLLQFINLTAKERSIFLTLLLASPLYRFWSWTGMIESTALFFSLAFMYYGILSTQKFSWGRILLACLFGIFGILTKITTFFAFHIAIAFYLLCLWWIKDGHRFNRAVLIHYCRLSLFLGAIPLSFALAWTNFADHIRGSNPLAEFLLESNLRLWTFGTLEEKLTLETWRVILERTLESSLGTFWFLIAAMALGFLSPHFFSFSFLLLALGLIVPLVFTHLHFVHDYYAYANSLFFISAFALLLIGLMRHSKIGFLLALGLFIGACFKTHESYNKGYLLGQLATRGDLLEIRNLFAQRPDENEMLLIWGYDWSPEIAYSSKRRTLMDRENRSLEDSRFQAALVPIKNAIGGAVFCQQILSDEVFIQERLNYLNLTADFTAIGPCRYYLKARR